MTLASAIADARPKVIAALAVHLRDLDLAEEAFAEAVEACLTQPQEPQNLAGWLFTTAKRKAIDTIRKHQAESRAVDGAMLIAEKASEMDNVIELPTPIADERLRLIFICCHPAIALEARAALALKVICGLPVAEIARVFLTSEATMFQRITRAKSKVRDAGIPFELPPKEAWRERLDAVLLTLELAYTVAYQDAAGEREAELSGEIVRLAELLAELFPEEPEALGLASLIRFAVSREKARVDDDGCMVPLSEQDTALWDREGIDRACFWLDQAAESGRTGPYQVMATIQLTHTRRALDGNTDWDTIVRLYDALLMLRPNPIVVLNRAMAIAKTVGPDTAFEELEALDSSKLDNARPYHAARAELLTQLGQSDAAHEALGRALELGPANAERLFLEGKRVALHQG